MPPFPQIDGYRITRLLGQGGMARVYAAVEAELDREVAIKVVSLDPDRDHEVVSRLEFEARSLARLRHPHIVELYRFGRLSTSALYYVMPLLTGGDLGHWLRPAPESKVCDLMQDLLDALGHAHQAGIVHRDVKPENILFDEHGRVQLADFGAAFALNTTPSSTSTRITQEGFAVGSLGYMSPEQARGQDVSGLSDLYSLAVVAFELLTDSRCHTGDDAVAIALAQIEQPPAQLPHELAHWQGFFARALNPDPHNRYQSAAAMKAALPVVQASSVANPHAARPRLTNVTRLIPVTEPNLTRKSLKKWQIAALMGIGMLCAISASTIAWYTWSKNQQQLQYERLQLQLTQAPEGAAAELLGNSAGGLSASQASELATKIMRRMLIKIQALALAEGDASANLNAIAIPWTKLDLLRRQYHLSDTDALIELEAALTRRVEETLILANERFDRATAQQVLPLAHALSNSKTSAQISPKYAETLQRAEAIPEVGGEFTDISGLRMRLVAAPKGNAAGLAIMANALSTAEYERYASELKLPRTTCTPASEVRGCFDQKQANTVASGLSTQFNSSLTVPSAAQWQQAYRFAPQLANKFAVSRECKIVRYTERPNVFKRTLGNIKSVFGVEKAQANAIQTCNGELVFTLNGSGKSTVASTSATVLVLVKVLR